MTKPSDSHAYLQDCTDQVIRLLGRFDSAEGKSDLAAAYYYRAQKNDDPRDLFPAWRAASEAVRFERPLPAAYFNKALIERALQLNDDARQSIDQFSALEKDAQWKDEMRLRRNEAELALNNGAAQRWPRMRVHLKELAARGEMQEAVRAVSVSIAAAYSLFYELLAQKDYKTAHFVAEAINNVSTDRFAIDLVDATEAGAAEPPATLAKMGAANAKKDVAALEAIETEAVKKGYRSFVAQLRRARGYALMMTDRHAESVRAYEAALSEFEKLQNFDSAAVTRGNLVGQWRTLGDDREASRAMIRALRGLPHVAGPEPRVIIFGEAAETALAAGYPDLALCYRDAFIDMLRTELVHAADLKQTESLHRVLAATHRGRADVLVALGQYDEAKQALAEMERLDPQRAASPAARAILDAQALEVEARTLLHSNPVQAAAKLTDAIKRGAEHLYSTYRANLYIQRSEANRRAGREAAADADLQLALAELAKEEQKILERRKRGDFEQVWSGYFSRFRNTYELLVAQSLKRRRVQESIHYTERARAFEPLALILQNKTVPAGFREKIADGAVRSVEDIQKELPDDTFLIEYLVRERETIVWVISKDDIQAMSLNAGAQSIRDWLGLLLEAVHRRNHVDFAKRVGAPSDGLLSAPLEAVAKLRRGRSGTPTLIFVPDDAMQGLPFSALTVPGTSRPLIEEYVVGSAPSATIYVYSLLRDRALPRKQADSVLLVLDPAFDPNAPGARGLNRLNFALSEDRSIGPLYETRTVLKAEQATVARFLANAPNHAVIHISAHGLPNPQSPHLSTLLLAKTADDDGALTAAELLTELDLDQTRLVVLAACSSAGGAPVGPEGVAPLVRPLLAAGVPGVIGSLWEVDDQAATELLTRFHQHYRSGMDAAHALRAAQLDLLRGGNRTVLAWAPFEVIGHASSPSGVPNQLQTQRSQ